jgi:hypothetical protein
VDLTGNAKTVVSILNGGVQTIYFDVTPSYYQVTTTTDKTNYLIKKFTTISSSIIARSVGLASKPFIGPDSLIYFRQD